MTTTQNTPELMLLDPHTLVVGDNARIDVTVDAKLVESIREHGVIEPLIAHRDAEGRVIVRMGQRRTLAACEAGVATVPVVITDAPADEAVRVIEQVEENDRRADMSGTDRVNIAATLSGLGLTPAQIAKRTKRDRAEVDAALAVAASEASRARMAEGMDLEAAAALAEFEGDEEATGRIERAIQWGRGVGHIVATIRQERRAAELVAARAAELEAEGVRVIERPESWPGYGPRPATVALSELVDKDGEGWGERAEAHRQVCKGHAVWLHSDGESVTETIGCQDYRSHGHKPRGSSQGSTQTAEERRAVIDGNRQWLAANEVRAEFLRGIAKAAKAPKGAELYTARAIAFGRIADAAVWYELRGVKMPRTRWHGTDREAVARALSRLSAQKLTVATLTMALGYMEERTSNKATWRATDRDVADYLTTLKGWGYSLSDAEAAYIARCDEATAKAKEFEALSAERASQPQAEAEAEQDDATE